MNSEGQRVLYAIVTASPAAAGVDGLVRLAHADGWAVCVVTSPRGREFVDTAALAARTGYPVRSEYKAFGAPDVLPPADAFIAAPVTCNSVAKWAAGISDTLPLGLLVEAVGKGQPVVAVPFSTPEHLSFPAIRTAIQNLAAWGVTVLDADRDVTLFPWAAAWQAILEHPRLLPER